MAATSQVSLNYPKVRESLTKVIKVVSGDTTAFLGAWLPKDAIILGMYVVGHAVNTAVTSATLGVGSTTAANEFVAGYDIKAAATGEGYSAVGAAAVGSAFMTKLTADTPVYAKITSAGGGDGGGPWFVKIEYTVPGSGEDVQM